MKASEFTQAEFDNSRRFEFESILDNLIACQCGEEFNPRMRRPMDIDDAFEYLARHLPAFNYVRTQLINFMFADGLTTGDEKQDEKLNGWLYSKNINGDTNYKVIQEVVAESMTYGRYGLRWLSEKDGVIAVDKRKYAPLTQYNTEYYGFKQEVGYIVSFGKEKIRPMKLSQLMRDISTEDIERDGTIVDKENKLLVLSKDQLLSIKNGIKTERGESVLEYDMQRIQLLETWYSRLNYDIEYDGPGRIILHRKAGYESEIEDEIGLDKVMSKQAQNKKGEMARKEINEIAKQVKDSSSDNVIVLSSMFEDNVDHLPRTTKATELLTFMSDNQENMIAQFFGVTPALFGLGKTAGNVSMEKVIDNAMVNSIVPMREKHAIQISAFLADKLGISKIYFNKYTMLQSTSENDERIKLVDMITKLTAIGTATAQAVAEGYTKLLLDELGDVTSIKNLASRAVNKVKKRVRTVLRRSKTDGK